MTTTDEQYVPSEDEMRRAYWLTRMLDHHAAVDAAFDRFLDRVRRDAARDAVEDADYWQARAYEAEGKLWKAEARIKAVEDVLDTVEDGHSTDPVIRGLFPRMVGTALVRRALDGA